MSRRGEEFGEFPGVAEEVLIEAGELNPWEIGSLSTDFYAIRQHGFGFNADAKSIPFVVFDDDGSAVSRNWIWRTVDSRDDWSAAEGIHYLIQVEITGEGANLIVGPAQEIVPTINGAIVDCAVDRGRQRR